jgi:hypothetical protein
MKHLKEKAFYSELLAVADQTRARFAQKEPDRTDIDLLREIIEENELVLGLCPDHSEPHGFDMLVIKGLAILERICSGAEAAREVSIAVIPCTERDEASAMRTVFGDDLENDGAGHAG